MILIIMRLSVFFTGIICEVFFWVMNANSSGPEIHNLFHVGGKCKCPNSVVGELNQ